MNAPPLPACSARSNPSRRRLAACALSLLLGGCNLRPDYHRPNLPAPPAWSGANAQDSAAWPATDWWRGFGSARLDGYIEQAQHANDDLAAAVARVRQADAQVRIAGAPLLPSLQLDLNASEQRAPSSGGGLQTYALYNPALSASYELDFWGKNRAALRSAQASAAASRYDQVTVELTVMSSVASTYFQALELRDRLDVAQKNLDAGQTILDGLKKEQQAGTATALDVAQQATTVAILYAAIPPLRQQLRQSVDALAILLGATPESLDIDSGSLAGLALPPVVQGLPSGLLARRPDVAEAEAQLIAANANVAVARAAFFPSIDLTASGGYESNQLAGLLNPANAVFSLAAGLTQPIFEGGLLEGQSEQAKGRYAELLADYHKAVLSAFGNVEDALAGVQQTAEQERRQREAVDAAQRAFGFAQAQMHAGTINVLTLLNTESALFTAQDALAQVQFAHLQALVNLYNALGGGWQQPGQDSAQSAQPGTAIPQEAKQ
jgi:NodT family efflux transporter outer membrane factor (OMF) lipoprotein